MSTKWRISIENCHFYRQSNEEALIAVHQLGVFYVTVWEKRNTMCEKDITKRGFFSLFLLRIWQAPSIIETNGREGRQRCLVNKKMVVRQSLSSSVKTLVQGSTAGRVSIIFSSIVVWKQGEDVRPNNYFNETSCRRDRNTNALKSNKRFVTLKPYL